MVCKWSPCAGFSAALNIFTTNKVEGLTRLRHQSEIKPFLRTLFDIFCPMAWDHILLDGGLRLSEKYFEKQAQEAEVANIVKQMACNNF
jgi:hypothetical protein